jgi:hypothetical protein
MSSQATVGQFTEGFHKIVLLIVVVTDHVHVGRDRMVSRQEFAIVTQIVGGSAVQESATPVRRDFTASGACQNVLRIVVSTITVRSHVTKIREIAKAVVRNFFSVTNIVVRGIITASNVREHAKITV